MILNWNENGKMYAKHKSQNLNPWIRGCRLPFVLLLAALDIGFALYNVIKYVPTPIHNYLLYLLQTYALGEMSLTSYGGYG